MSRAFDSTASALPDHRIAMSPVGPGPVTSPSQSPGMGTPIFMTLSLGGYARHIVSQFVPEFKVGRSYSPAEEERAQRRGHSNNVANNAPPRPNISDSPVLPDVTASDTPPTNSPLPPTSNRLLPSAISPLPNDSLESPSPQSTSEDPLQPPPDSVPAVVPQEFADPVVETMNNCASKSGCRPTQDFTEGVLQNPPVTSEPPASDLSPPASNDLLPPASDDPLPPPTTTALPPNDPTSVAGSSGHLAAVPANPKVFTFDGASTFISADTIKYWDAVPGGKQWIDMVKVYLQFEQLHTPKAVRPILPSSILC